MASLAGSTGAARADPPAPRRPTPFALPSISHARSDAEIAWTLGTASPVDDARSPSRVALARASFESPVALPRRLYAGGSIPLVSALPPDGSGGAKPLVGNVELHGRAVFPMPSWLATGFVLGVALPTASFDRNGPSASAALAAASLDPTNAVDYLPGALTLRPALDMRLLRGPLVVQVRDGLDIVFDTAGVRRVKTRTRLLGHVGVLATPALEISAEIAHAYLFDSDIPDASRSALTLGPNVRVSLGRIDIGAGAFTDVSSPLSPSLSRFVAMRLSLVAHL